MKPAIFLLSLGVFSKVCADDQFMKDLKNLRNRTISQMNGIMNELFSRIHFVIQDARRQGIGDDINDCYKEYDAMLQYHQGIFMNCVQCYTKATQNKDIQTAEKCFNFNVAALQTQANLRRFSTNRCITKYLSFLGQKD
ncbi:uncharacterized protein LOC117170539 [Belonocnema kinseyi]|uniref:uncharacterized protein LOC117170539 n=1 Tax=Belonocnema kinseyi TaxID=2817044 RepID=UPI00143D5265|nr:uncharacterized protein LOC117170539 [Belonocnema kinseyi]